MNIYPMNILPNDGSSLASHPTDDTKSEPWPTNLEAVWGAYVTNGDWCWKKRHQRVISFKSSVFNDPSRTRLCTDWCHQSSDTVGWNPSLERPAEKKGCTTKKHLNWCSPNFSQHYIFWYSKRVKPFISWISWISDEPNLILPEINSLPVKNRPKPWSRRGSSNHPFSCGNPLLVSGRVWVP